MTPTPGKARTLLAVAAMAALVATSGCSMFRSKSGYESSPESRPLEVPPDLTLPRSDSAMAIPQVRGGSATTGTALPGTAVPGTVPAAAAGNGFAISDSVDSAWQRVGVSLGRIDGVDILNRAQVIGAYEVRFGGSDFLIRVQAEGSGSRVSATAADGRALTSGPAAELLGILRGRLG